MSAGPGPASTGPVQAANLGLRFILEIAMLAALAYWGIHTGDSTAADVALGVGAPLLVAVAWGVFAAPKSSRQLKGAALVGVQLALLGLGAAAFIAAGQTALGVAFAVVVVLNAALLELSR